MSVASQTDRILPLALRGDRPWVIAHSLMLSQAAVNSAMARLRKKGLPVPRHPRRAKRQYAPMNMRDRLTIAHDYSAATWILREVAEESGATVVEILSESRERRVMLPRHHAMRRMFVELGMSYSAIGRRMRRDHTTVMAACKAVAR